MKTPVRFHMPHTVIIHRKMGIIGMRTTSGSTSMGVDSIELASQKAISPRKPKDIIKRPMKNWKKGFFALESQTSLILRIFSLGITKTFFPPLISHTNMPDISTREHLIASASLFFI